MTNLVESILTITKMDNHELKLRNVKIELGEFIEEQLEILQGISDHKRLVFERGHREVTVLADPELLTRIFRNIISNCSRYAETKVDIHLELQEKRVIMTIEDDGAGFTEMDLRHIFERFYRGARRRQRIEKRLFMVQYTGCIFLADVQNEKLYRDTETVQ